MKGRAGCRLGALQEAAGTGAARSSAAPGKGQRAAGGGNACGGNACGARSGKRKEEGGGVEKWMSATHYAIKVHIENMNLVLIFHAFNRCCAKFCETVKSNSESIPLMEGSSNRRSRPPKRWRKQQQQYGKHFINLKLRFYLRNVKAKLPLRDQRDLYYSTQLHLKRQNRDILRREKGLLSLARAVKQLEPLSGLTPPGLVLFSLPRHDTGNGAMHPH